MSNKNDHFCAALHKKEIRCRVFENIAAYISFIPVIVYFFKDVKRKELHKNIKRIAFKE